MGLYWQRYGRAGPGMQISGLEEEFQLARARALPRLLYVKTPAPDREPRLVNLLDRGPRPGRATARPALAVMPVSYRTYAVARR